MCSAPTQLKEAFNTSAPWQGGVLCNWHTQELSTLYPLRQWRQEENIAQEPLTCISRERTSQKVEEDHVAASLVNANSPLMPATRKHLLEDYLSKFSVVGTEAPLKIELAQKWDMFMKFHFPLCPLLWEKRWQVFDLLQARGLKKS